MAPRLSPQGRLAAWVIAAGVFVACALAVGTIGSTENGTIEFELRKSIIQFLLIVALGAVVAIVVDAAKRRVESEARRRQHAADTVTALLQRLDELYRDIKRERRSLGLVQLPMTYAEYKAAMWSLSEKKQEIEGLWREIQVVELWLPELQGVSVLVHKMEDYFEPLESEWQVVAASPNKGFHEPELQGLSKFRATSASGKSDFHGFRTPYYEARNTLIRSLSAHRNDD